jgi:hypothetical protein
MISHRHAEQDVACADQENRQCNGGQRQRRLPELPAALAVMPNMMPKMKVDRK